MIAMGRETRSRSVFVLLEESDGEPMADASERGCIRCRDASPAANIRSLLRFHSSKRQQSRDVTTGISTEVCRRAFFYGKAPRELSFLVPFADRDASVKHCYGSSFQLSLRAEQ
ncbi:hypothetical protein MRX96_001316 [Rhipicephalus microplus]